MQIEWDVFFFALPPVAPTPDLLLFGRAYQLLAEVRMRNVDECFGTLPGRLARQARDAVFRYDIRCLGTRGGDNITAGKVWDDVGVKPACLIREGCMHGKEGSSVLCLHGAGNEVNLTAPDYENIYKNYPNVKAYWNLWNSTR